MENKKYIYVVLSQTGTRISKAIKFFTRKPYNHVSVSSDNELMEMFSFCRLHLHRPLPAGFSPEYLEKGVFNLFSIVPCEIYKFEVTEHQYDKYLKTIRHFKNNTDVYSYNILGLLTIPFGIPIRRKHRFVCSQFVAYVLNRCKIAEFSKDISLITPEDFRYLQGGELIYSGNLKNFSLSIPVLSEVQV